MIAKNTCAIYRSVYEGESEIAIIITIVVVDFSRFNLSNDLLACEKNKKSPAGCEVCIVTRHEKLTRVAIQRVQFYQMLELKTRFAMNDPDFSKPNRSSRDNIQRMIIST